MIDIGLLFSRVLLLLLMVLPGFAVRKADIVNSSAPKTLADIVLYILQPAMLLSAFIRPFDSSILINIGWILLFSFLSHTVFYLLSFLFFRRAPDKLKKVYRFGVVFSNAGYMGIPLITAIFGNDAAIYAAIYVIGFSFFSWSAGRFIYTGNRIFISLKKIFFNPSTIPTYIGIIIFIFSLSDFIPLIIVDFVSSFGDAVAPISMLLVGMRLAEINVKGALNKYLPLALLLRLIVFPLIILIILKVFVIFGIYESDIVTSVTVICASTPAATMTSMLAEKYDCSADSAGVFVSVSTLFSVVTMPLLGFLANL